MPLVLPFRSASDVQVTVGAEVPHSVTQAIEGVARGVLHHISGAWTLIVSQSVERGAWRIELRGSTGRHLWTIVGACERLPELIAAKLRTFIEVATAQFQYHTFRS